MLGRLSKFWVMGVSHSSPCYSLRRRVFEKHVCTIYKNCFHFLIAFRVTVLFKFIFFYLLFSLRLCCCFVTPVSKKILYG